MKQRMSKKVDSVISIIFSVLFMPVIMYLTAVCFLRTGYNAEVFEAVRYRNDNILINIVGLCCFAGLMFLFSFILGKLSKKLQAVLVSVIVVLFSCLWIFFTKTQAEADQYYVAVYAETINEGVYNSLDVGGYLAIYRQQLGMVTILRIIYNIFGAFNYEPFRYMVACLLPVMVCSGYYVVSELSDGNEKAGRYYLTLLLTFFPMVFYTPYVYGDLLSVIFLFAAFACVFWSVRSNNPLSFLLLFLSLSLAVWVRKNSLIVLIAVFIAGLFSKQLSVKKKIILLAVILVAAFVPSVFNNVLYGSHIPKDAETMPAILHITMGLQMNENAGWYNGYNMDTFAKAGYDADTAAKIAWSDAKELMDNFVKNPKYAASFYRDKIESQWNVPLLASLELNSSFKEEPSKIINSVYNGKIYTCVLEFMNIWQLFVYFCTVLFGVVSFKKRDMLHNVLIIAIFGGFLFSILWEAKTRYVLGYVMLMIPCAACGFAEAEKFFREKIFNKSKVRKN